MVCTWAIVPVWWPCAFYRWKGGNCVVVLLECWIGRQSCALSDEDGEERVEEDVGHGKLTATQIVLAL